MKLVDSSAGGRFAFIDKMKAVGILLIMIGHAPGLSQIKIFIYAFHVPLFFIISGFLLSERHLLISVQDKLIKLFKSLLVPFFCFFFISWLYWCVTKQYANLPMHLKDKSCIDALSGIYIGTGSALFVNPALWFFVALFWVSLIYHISFKFLFNKVKLLFFCFIFFIFSIIFFYEALNSPHVIALQVMAGLFFYSLGAALKEKRLMFFMLKNRIFFLLVFVPVFLLLALKNGPVDLNLLIFGYSPFLYLFVAVLGVFCLYLLVDFFGSRRFVTFLSRNSLLIFATHMVIFKFITGVFQVSTGHNSPYLYGDWYFNLMYVFLTLVIIYLVSPVVNKNIPWLVGVR